MIFQDTSFAPRERACSVSPYVRRMTIFELMRNGTYMGRGKSVTPNKSRKQSMLHQPWMKRTEDVEHDMCYEH
jgi:hypothetical protein